MSKHSLRFKSIVSLILAIGIIFTSLPRIDNHNITAYAASGNEFTIQFLDVGQADAALITCDGQTLMIDGGNAADSSFIYSYLKSNNISNIDYMICTHPHEDHAGGLAGALNAATVGIAYAPFANYDNDTFNAFTKYLGKQGKSVTVPHHGDTFNVGSAKVTFVGPVYPELATDVNDTSIMAKIQYGNTSFLFTGDAGVDEELEILGTGYDVTADVLKVGHHGAADSTCATFLNRVNPKYAVISCGSNNSYGHPKSSVIDELKSKGLTLYRTDMQGTITCTSDGTKVTMQPERNAGVDTFIAGSTSDTNRSDGSAQSSGSASATAAAAVAAASAVMDNTSDTGTGTTYILNTNTKKFHYPHCSSVSDMKEKNKKEYTGSRDDVISQGYVPCKRCNP